MQIKRMDVQIERADGEGTLWIMEDIMMWK